LEAKLGFEITLNRYDAVVAQLKSSGAQVSDAHLRNLGFDPTSTREKVRKENVTCALSDAEYTDAEYSDTDYDMISR
jgi:topoisomerase IA-like protein